MAIAAASSSVAVKSGVGTAVAACQPSRIFETYELDLCQAPAGMCGLHWDRKSGALGLLTQSSPMTPCWAACWSA